MSNQLSHDSTRFSRDFRQYLTDGGQNLATSRLLPSRFDGYQRAAFMPDGSKEEKGEVRFTPPPQVWEYLGWLARNTLLGKDEREVARQILITKLSEMRQETYRDPQKK